MIPVISLEGDDIYNSDYDVSGMMGEDAFDLNLPWIENET